MMLVILKRKQCLILILILILKYDYVGIFFIF